MPYTVGVVSGTAERTIFFSLRTLTALVLAAGLLFAYASAASASQTPEPEGIEVSEAPSPETDDEEEEDEPVPSPTESPADNDADETSPPATDDDADETSPPATEEPPVTEDPETDEPEDESPDPTHPDDGETTVPEDPTDGEEEAQSHHINCQNRSVAPGASVTIHCTTSVTNASFSRGGPSQLGATADFSGDRMIYTAPIDATPGSTDTLTVIAVGSDGEARDSVTVTINSTPSPTPTQEETTTAPADPTPGAETGEDSAPSETPSPESSPSAIEEGSSPASSGSSLALPSGMPGIPTDTFTRPLPQLPMPGMPGAAPAGAIGAGLNDPAGGTEDSTQLSGPSAEDSADHQQQPGEASGHLAETGGTAATVTATLIALMTIALGSSAMVIARRSS